MGTKLLGLVKRQSKKLSARAPEIFWSLLSQLYHAHQSSGLLKDLLPIIRERNFDKALDLADSWSLQKYETAYEHYVRNQFAYLIKKTMLPSRYNPEERSIKKFLESESTCAITNRRFASWCIDTDSGVSQTRRKYNVLLRRMRSFIAYTLGDEVPLSSVFANVGFGPGASLGVSGRASNAMRKLLAKEALTVSPRAATYVAGAISHNLWLRRVYSLDPDGHTNGTSDPWFKAMHSGAKYVRYNKLAFVPKTAKILRVIAVEPLGNNLIQKGGDIVMRHRLKRIGIDLSSQTKNQEFARLGSLNLPAKEIATIDMVSASDTVAIEPIRKLFPGAWFEFLNSIRSHSYEHNGENRVYHKFSSMGNGTTFPIETLVFVAACHAVGCGVPGRDFTVYGDDIAIPAQKARDLIKLLRVLGFRTNIEKTFIEGPFRESCGEDWFDGISVRPFVLDYALDSVQNVFKFLNQTRSRTLWVDFFEPVRDYVLRLLPVNLRFFRPFEGDVESGIDGSFDECAHSPYVRYKGHGEYSWTEITSTPRKDIRDFGPGSHSREPPDFVMWYGIHTLTSGDNTIVSLNKRASVEIPWFTLRRSNSTAISRKTGSGATSNWLPQTQLV